VLIVDDRRDNLLVLQQVIRQYQRGWRVVLAAGADEGLAQAAAGSLDVVLVDLQMPGMDGIEMCRRLKEMPAMARVPLMLMTSHSSDPVTRARGLEAGADDFINRPIDNVELVARIRVLLRMKRSEDELMSINAKLEERVRERTVELQQALDRQAQLARKILQAQEQERARVARELHDELGQTLSAIYLELEWLRKQAATDAGTTAATCETACDLARGAADELRRVCWDLRPPLLDDLGLAAAARQLVKELSRRAAVALDVQLDMDDQLDLPPEQALCAYRVIQESMRNSSRHGAATQVIIRAQRRDNELVVTVRDNGCGFDTTRLCSTEGSGIAGMQERAHLIGAGLAVWSEPRQGTVVTLRLPLCPQPVRRP